MEFISLKHITKYYLLNKIKQQVLSDINLEVAQGESISIIGSSGSGKSTLLKIIGLLDNPSSGSISFQGKECSEMGESNQTENRREFIGFIFQSYNLLPDFTALENVMFAQEILGVQKKVALKNAKALFSQLNIADKCENYPSELSGGEQQRVAIARSLINKPKLILADEPTGNLDEENTNNVAEILKNISKDHNITTITVTHDINIANRAGKIYGLNKGKLEWYS